MEKKARQYFLMLENRTWVSKYSPQLILNNGKMIINTTNILKKYRNIYI